MKASRHAQKTVLPPKMDDLPRDAHVNAWIDYLIDNPDVPLADIEPVWVRTYVSWFRD